MNIILIGACGKMGRITAELGKDEIVCGVDLFPEKMSFPVYPHMNDIKEQAEAAIDFSSRNGLDERLSYCQENNIALVLAATGFSKAEEGQIRESSKKIPIVKTANLSIGIALMQILVQKAAETLQGFDVEIIERHHNQKKDAPSGTALLLSQSILEGFGKDSPLCLGRKNEKRKEGEIGLHAVRGGNIPGIHEAMFAGEDEILSITHTVLNRTIFARGALCAAHWLSGKSPGLYNMQDVLTLT